MKFFTPIFYSMCVVFLLTTSTCVASFSKYDFSKISSEVNESKVFKLYFKNGFLKHGDKEKIKAALLEKSHINECVISNQNGFDIFTIKADQVIEKKNILTIINRLGFYFDKQANFSITQE